MSETSMHKNNAEPQAAVSRFLQTDCEDANGLPGPRWTLEGEVIHGDKRGRLLGFPTANVILPDDVRLAYGVYAVRVLVKGRIEKGVACFGIRPQFDSGAPRLEIHILDFKEDIYGERIKVEIVAFQRDELRFADVQALIEQMARDCAYARQLLSHSSERPEVEIMLEKQPTKIPQLESRPRVSSS